MPLEPCGEGGVKNGGCPWIRTGTSHVTVHCPPVARHSGVAAGAAISSPYETPPL